MKWLLPILLVICNVCQAQNYQCLQSGVKHYFVNANGYLRGTRIDSVKTYADSTVYYPFHTIRGNYPFTYPFSVSVDSNGGSWLGGHVIQLSSGEFLFDNLWHDTVVINTQANVGDSWIFFRDTTQRYYKAAVVGAGMMTFAGITDSVKTITITAYDDTGNVPGDPVNNFQLILSKNNGFAQAFDLYTFPYHAPDAVYAGGFDYFLDVVIQGLGYGSTITTSNAIFSLIALANPTRTELYDWNVGDAFENQVYSQDVTSDGSYPYCYYYDSIVGKTAVPGGVQYNYSGWVATEYFGAAPIYAYVEYDYSMSPVTGTFFEDSNRLIDTNIMPEETKQPYLEYYFPLDTQYCVHSCLYYFTSYNFGAFHEISPITIYYKTGIGLVHYDLSSLSVVPNWELDTAILYYNRSGVSCGDFNTPTVTGVATVVEKPFQIYPNPATTFININAQTPITEITICNVVGQTVYTNNYNSQQVQIDVSSLPPGLYFVKVNGSEVRKWVKE